MAFFDFLHIFTDLFNASRKAWHKLEPQEQAALVHGSAIIHILNKTAQELPQVAYDEIEKAFPDITKEKLTEGLNAVAKGFTTVQDLSDPDLLVTIKNIQQYLLTLQGKFWEEASSIASQVLSTIFAPDQTPFAKIVSLIEFAYREFVKH